MRHLVILLIGMLFLFGCSPASESGEEQMVSEAVDGPTWHGEIKQIIDENCTGCHVEGGGTPFVFDSYEAVKALAAVALNSMETGSMPPWMPDPDCRHYQNQRVMDVGQIATFKAWVDNNTPEGQVSTLTQDSSALSINEQLEALGVPAFVARSEMPYTPSAEAPDDYRCFQVGDVFETDTFVKATRIIPDAKAIVHHVLLYVISPQDVPALEARDASEAGPGYTCFGGPGVGQSFGPIAGWAPGGLPQIAPEGSARYIPAGSKLVMQLHYNVLNGGIEPDQTSVEFYTTEEIPEFEINAVPQPHLGIDILAGDANSVQVTTFPVTRPELQVIAVAPHMHSIGSKIRVDLVRANGSEECLVDIPAWDFNWQQTYEFLDDQRLVAQQGDEFRLTCTYDNSAANQPVINGERIEPRRVGWGDGTLDEMCLNYITTIKPFEARQARCETVSSCRSDCTDPNGFDCLLNCAELDLSCGQCLVLGMVGAGGCARTECGESLAQVGPCFRECVGQLVSGGSVTDCLSATCPAEYEAFNACMSPVLADGRCDEDIAECTD